MTNPASTTARCGIPALGAALVLALAAPTTASAASPCGLGFLNSATVPVIDGQQTSAGEWADASVLTASASGCLNMLIGLDLLDHDVTIRTKRYMRSGQLHLGFRFDVVDATQTAAGGGLLTSGERIAIQFDHNASGGGTLAADDRRIIITHRWETATPADPVITNVQVSWSGGTGPSGICGGGPAWQVITPPPPHAVAVRKAAGGYIVEFEIQASALGPIATNFGVAAQVVDDWGDTATLDGVLANSAAASFPAALPYSTSDNALNGCNASWRVPQDWGTGFFTSAPVDVWIARTPVFWNSVDVAALACTTPSYTYHPTQPCRLTLTARVHKNVTGPQTRNVLFVWADHGSSPSTWRVVDLQENVVITDTVMTVTSAQWSGVPTGLANHPCVRAYILPAAYVPSFNKAAILGITNAAQLAAMEAAYDIEPHHWAQKNISAPGGSPTCTVEGCSIGLAPAARGGMFALVAHTLGPQPLAAQQQPAPQMLPVAAPDARQPAITTAQQQETRVRLSPIDRRLLSRHAFAQVRAIGWEPGPVDSLHYILAEPLGGLIQAIPLELLRANDNRFDMRFNVGNPGTVVRHVFLVVDTEVPAGHEGLNVRIDTRPRRMQPNAEERREATVHVGPAPRGGGRIPGCGGGGGQAAVGFGLLFFWVAYGRRRRSD